ncbi:hypothetical protein [Campylobacter fetus]|uniref:hypothetical protein n=1 Tax=Campylobacter fetus TaxID=196 RepID=UPI000A85337E|nr:hypothetical protein [Campylobacter fetus]
MTSDELNAFCTVIDIYWIRIYPSLERLGVLSTHKKNGLKKEWGTRKLSLC